MNFEVTRFAPEAEEQQQNTFKLARDVKTLMRGPHQSYQIISTLPSSAVLCKRSRSGVSASQIDRPSLSVCLI